EGYDKAQVTLDGDWTLNPAGDDGLTYSWTDVDGNVVSTSAKPTLELEAGRYRFTLTVTDSQARKSSDEVLVVVSDDDTLLTDNFNDGDADGWSRDTPEIALDNASTEDFGIDALPGD